MLTICRQCLQSPYYRELFIKKHKSKGREVNFWSPSYGSPWARGIWPIIGIFLIWINERKNDITWLIFSPLPSRVNGFTVILLIVTFTCLTAVSACPVVILCQCPGQLWEDSSTASMNVFQLPILSHSCLFKCCFSPWSLKYLFSLKHVVLEVRYIFAQLSPRIILTWFIFFPLPFLLLSFYRAPAEGWHRS